MNLPIQPPYPPMEARVAQAIPNGPDWQYEPKWDGFRCLAFRDDTAVELQSKATQPLARYFPELVKHVQALKPKSFVLDGEIIVPIEGRPSFDELLMRIHPAESRIQKLAAEHPATLVVFDLLVDERGQSLVELPLRERRPRLEKFAQRYFPAGGSILLSPATCDFEVARAWLRELAGGLDGIIAKRLDAAYRTGERSGMEKIKNRRTADCVVGGFRYAEKEPVAGSLLLGLYDEEGLLNHVGFTSSMRHSERAELTGRLEALIQPPGFDGRAPGGPSRWNTARSAEWKPLAAQLVVEVEYDHFTGGRFRHGTKFCRWRPDKSPLECRMAQVERESRSPLDLLETRA